MLILKQIVKQYDAGDSRVEALRGVDLSFRAAEFAAILGPSGCGKTTLLNIIGGLDQYTSGDLIINGRSTRDYTDADWDAYRNHTIGFVFQSYNLIPHQTVLSNVELALTLSGVSRQERRSRAIQALERVGLRDQMKKRPNQMSGGQMQRVAIARALVNDPDILLADEPTGALDSETSVQVMEILKEISKTRLVIMVTHNPELAARYATRTIRLLDGRVVDDSAPCAAQERDAATQKKEGTKDARRKPAMRFATALSLSLNNLMTKKGRTILTAFAGSIGIIGIALILSLSAGVNGYIERVERDTLSSYPLRIEKQTVDMSGVMSAMAGAASGEEAHVLDKVYSGQRMTNMLSGMMNEVRDNNLSAFKAYLESGESGVDALVSGIQYDYATPLTIYRELPSGEMLQVNPSTTLDTAGFGEMMSMYSASSLMTSSMARMNVFQPLIDNEELLASQYDVLAGRMPRQYDEAVLIVNSRNEISDYALYTLGLKDPAEIKGVMEKLMAGQSITSEDKTFTYDEILALRFRLLVNTDVYRRGKSGWEDMRGDAEYMKQTLEGATEIRIVGILRPAEDAVATSHTGGVGYLNALMQTLLERVNESEIVREQLQNPEIDVFTGRPFADAKVTLSAKDILDNVDQAPEQYREMLGKMTEEQLDKLLSNPVFAGQAQRMADAEKSSATLEENLTRLGVSDPASPNAIQIYPRDFESKEKITALIADYNAQASEEDQIKYTDYVGLMMSSVTTVVNAISYVLIAFVAISLVVSSIMIGIITYISVLERTKEIGILRAIGASKRDVSRVFNAETLIIGFAAGALGIAVTLLCNLGINAIIYSLTSIRNAAGLPAVAALALVGISMALTFIAGLIPSRMAAKKDPVVALRTE